MSSRRILFHRWLLATIRLTQRHRGIVMTAMLGVQMLVGCDSRPTVNSRTAGGDSPPGRPTASTSITTANTSAWLQDVTGVAGFRFHHDSGAHGQYSMPEHIGSGIAVLDADSDGLMDFYCVQNGGERGKSKNQLFRQVSVGVFADASKDSGLDLVGRGMGAIAGRTLW
jgi:hypothetical protein